MKAPTFFNVAVVGMHFREKEGVAAKSIVANFVPPVQLDYEREPHNRFDENAIKILYDGDHIGYLEASQAIFIAPWMDEGHKYTVTVTQLEPRRNNLHPLTTVSPLREEEALETAESTEELETT